MPSYKVDKKVTFSEYCCFGFLTIQEGVYMISVFYFLLAVLYPYGTIIHRLVLVSVSLLAFITAFLDFPETFREALRITQRTVSIAVLLFAFTLIGTEDVRKMSLGHLNFVFFYGSEDEWHPLTPTFFLMIVNFVAHLFESIIVNAKTAAEYKRKCERGEIYDVALVGLS